MHHSTNAFKEFRISKETNHTLMYLSRDQSASLGKKQIAPSWKPHLVPLSVYHYLLSVYTLCIAEKHLCAFSYAHTCCDVWFPCLHLCKVSSGTVPVYHSSPQAIQEDNENIVENNSWHSCMQFPCRVKNPTLIIVIIVLPSEVTSLHSETRRMSRWSH